MGALLWLINAVLSLIIWILVINAILSWLIAFDVVNRRNRLVDTIWTFTQRLTEPLLRPIRRVVPLIGGIDLSPMILILLILFLQRLIPELVVRFGLV
ncbi:MAG: YggT family protein [Hyphomonadaceae bacterium]